jgi:hypothetical protein
MRSLSIATLFLAIATLAGCAGAQNTLAQDLAWDRWKACEPKFTPHVTLAYIRLDGQVFVNYRTGGELAAVGECLKTAGQEQAKRGPVVVPQIVGLVGSPDQNAQALNLKPGSEWAYRSETPQAKSTFVWVLDREEVRNGAMHYVVKTGTREIFVRKNDLAYSLETVDGSLDLERSPAMEILRWPLTVGTEWQQTYTVARPKARTTEEITSSCKIEARENVVVPAGSFQAFKSVCTNTRTGKTIFTIWYAPEVGSFVREVTPLTAGGVRERELIQYRLR